jgi:two-component system, sensor histidine kinase SagS
MTYHDPVMTSSRPRLVILKGTNTNVGLEASQIQALKSVFDVVEVHSPEAAKKMIDGDAGGMVICAPGEYLEIGGERLTGAAILERIGDGIGMVDSHAALLWTDARFKVHDEQVRSAFVRACRIAMEQFNAPAGAPNRRHVKRFDFSSDGCHYELIVAPGSLDQTQDRVTTVVGVIWDVSNARQVQETLRKIDAAGADLVRIDPAAMSKMNMAERLKMFEQKIVRALREVMHFDNFEVRLLDRETTQLELVIAENISPLKVGEVIYARPEGNGISGYVASTGQAYNCPDVQNDPLYREGLDNAASSLTVPLMLEERVIGTLNIESSKRDAFNENDQMYAERFGRYIASALNILDMLVIERFTTNEQAAANIVGELSVPLAELTKQVNALRTLRQTDEAVRGNSDQILQTITRLTERLRACAAGPRSVLGAEQELHRLQPDPLLVGKRILIADDEPAIRDTLSSILTQKGANVTVCTNGGETIEAIEKAAKVPGEFFDMVISDIKMPDRNGYEVYRTAKAISANTPVVLMTGFGYDPHHSIVRASQEGLQSFLFKPFKVSQLMDVVTKSLAKR